MEKLTKDKLRDLFQKHCFHDTEPGELILVRPVESPNELYAVQQWTWGKEGSDLVLGGPLEEDENHDLKGFSLIQHRSFDEGWLFAGIAKVLTGYWCRRVSWE